MATETTALVNTAPSGASSALGLGTIKAFLVAHPIGVAVVGGALVGTGTYYLMNKFLKKKEEPAAA
jgi:phosphotransferase system  glucose/maltose/N-acetylglucosamine-specific IIC component